MSTSIQMPRAASVGTLSVIGKFDVERVRIAAEVDLIHRIAKNSLFAALEDKVGMAEPSEIRRTLLAHSLRLTDTMAPDAYRLARESQGVLGVEGPIELYQANGRENAAIHMVQSPILLEIHGRLLPLLDEGGLRAVFGHELGHYLAHGVSSRFGQMHAVANALCRHGDSLPEEFLRDLRALGLLAELTADRMGLLACQDLDAVLRLEMVATTGLSGDALTWDTAAYLAQCKELMEEILRGNETVQGTTHPEHSVRAYAAWLFSESDTYRALTGRGPGTRKQADIDSLLWRFIGGGIDVELGDYHMLDEPPPELHECALAASVIVAYADGELADQEREAIERIFAPLVSDFREFFELEVAIARFHATALFIAAGGTDLLRSLYTLLVHVLGADGQVDPREVAAILGIGEVLGCRELFRKLLGMTLSTLQVSIDVEETIPIEPPLPTRKDEAKTALDAFMQGIARRGTGSVTLRRLLRLMGSSSSSAGLVRNIAVAAQTAGIAIDIDLQGIGLDERFVLRALAPGGDRPNAPIAIDASRANLIQALGRLRDQLISGDGRSPSVRLRKLRPGRTFDLCALDKVSVGLAERTLAQLTTKGVARMIEAAEAGRHQGAKTCASELLALDREHKLRMEELGANDLFVGYPFLTGNVVTVGPRGGTYLVRAPLLLLPVDLVREGQGARGFSVRSRKDESPFVNQSLLRLLFAKKGFAFTDELADELDALAEDPAQGVDGVIAKLNEVGIAVTRRDTSLRPFTERGDALAEREEFMELEECAVLGLFPQSSSDLLQDYDGLLAELPDPKIDVATLLASGMAVLPAGLRTQSRAVAPASPATALATLPIAGADPSQRKVIETCQHSVATVVDGPPGTGKSQVIVNLVTEALRRGERVAVVCEKRAALDVVRQRLEQLGLRHALGVVHDIHDDRKELYEQIAKRIDEIEPLTLSNAEAERVAAEHRSVSSVLSERAALLRTRIEEGGLTAGQLHVLASSMTAPDVSGSEALARLSYGQFTALLETVASLHPLRDLWRQGARARGPEHGPTRKSFSQFQRVDLDRMQRELLVAIERARDCERLMEASPVPGEVVEQARGGLEALRSVRYERGDAAGQRVVQALVAVSAGNSHGLNAVQEARDAWEEGGKAMLRFARPIELSATPELRHALAVALSCVDKWYRVFLLRFWRARSVVQEALRAHWPEGAGQPMTRSLLEELTDRTAAGSAWKRIATVWQNLDLADALPRSADAVRDSLKRIERVAPLVGAFVASRAVLTKLNVWVPQNEDPQALDAWDRKVDGYLSLVSAREALRQATAPIRAWLPWMDALPSAGDLDELFQFLTRDGERLIECDDLLERATHALPSCRAILDSLCHSLSDEPHPRWRNALLRAWAKAHLANLERRAPAHARLGTAADDHEVERAAENLVRLEDKRGKVELERVRAILDQVDFLQVRPAEKNKRRSEEQRSKELVLKECRKKRSVMPLRSFVRRFAGEGLLDVLPVWLLSPETIAVLFPRAPLFDVIIFDEASQCTVESGFPVLLRGKRLVIAGDEKQMPPTSYFTLGGSNDDDDEQEAEPSTDALEIRDMLSAESLLTLARGRVTHAGLQWHYRCRDESLIAFSNHAMYRGSLLTIPATAGPTAASALCWRQVTNGEYDAGVNRPEAVHVVDLLHEQLSLKPAPSIGIVTFNLKQRRTILDAIDERCANDSAFSSLWHEAAQQESLDHRPFVKNLENVQGDERDVIVFSLGHAPRPRSKRAGPGTELYVPARFGPLGQRGGERRLNVAISRAKERCFIVSSFEPKQLSVASTRNEGPRLFKHFLEFAHLMSNGHRAQANRVLDMVRETRREDGVQKSAVPIEGYHSLEAQICLALEQVGIGFEQGIGASEFRIPIAIPDPADRRRYLLAILTDEGTEPMDPFEQHVHRPAVLKQRGWKVLQVTAASWTRRSSEIVAQIKSMLDGAPDVRTLHAPRQLTL